jgi:hypothetical protein
MFCSATRKDGTMLHKMARMIGRMFDSTHAARMAEHMITDHIAADQMMQR